MSFNLSNVYNSVENADRVMDTEGDEFISIVNEGGEFRIARSPKSQTVARSLVSQNPITDSESYHQSIQSERCIIILILLFQVILGPIAIRYCMGARASNDQSYPTQWGSDLDSFEIYFLLVIFANLINFIFRMLPALCGKPTTIESVKECELSGSALLCVCSPFCAEADALLIRNMLGRTCTLFATIDGRHSIKGFYIDATMNERRIVGEANRKNIFRQWITFMAALVKVCQNKHGVPKLQASHGQDNMATEITEESNDRKSVGSLQLRNHFNSWVKYGESIIASALTGELETIHGAVVIDVNDEVKIRGISEIEVDIEAFYPPTEYTSENFETSSPLIHGPERNAGAVKRRRTTVSVNAHPGDRPLEESINGLEVDMESIQPMISFLNHWLRNMKDNEKVYGYGDNTRCVNMSVVCV